MHPQAGVGPQIEHLTARLVSIDQFAAVSNWALISQLVAQRPNNREIT